MYQSRSRLVIAAAVLVLTAACGQAGSAGTTGSGDADVTAARDLATKLENPLSGYPLPTAELTRTASLRGKTVYYVPVTQQAPQFTVTANALKDALTAAGLTLQVCNGGSNPSQISACVSQATAANAGAVITDSIPYALAANALNAARAKGIPVLVTDQIPDPAHPADATLGYVQGAGGDMLRAVADWIIADSGGTAKVLINQSTDSPSTVSYVEQAKQEFSGKCPGCTVVVNPISSANYSLIASSTSSAVLRNPGVNYVVSEFDQYLQPTLQGVQQSGRMSSIKGVSTAAQLSGLQMLAAKNFLHVDAGQGSAYQGWVSADAALRLMLKEPLPTYTIPLRLFTRDNVGSVEVTAAAEASGAWFGPTDYPQRFKTLWGVAA
ncbi:sugar ABC transporter substrate-binding protein [Amycolatopsis sp. NPDC098790]|uniref:sugar ABC transporter substrate-binding protein n=1 Tax=Amycolatopsis sp. NPDC098790 TaxID=3363939 RepID=UPI0038120ED0